MNETNDILTMRAVEADLRCRGFDYYHAGDDDYFFEYEGKEYGIYCGRLPLVFLLRMVDLEDEYRPEELLSALNSVNSKFHPVKVCTEGTSVAFILCLRNESVRSFHDHLPDYLCEVDNAVESFSIACRLYGQSHDPIVRYMEQITDVDNPFYQKRDILS